MKPRSLRLPCPLASLSSHVSIINCLLQYFHASEAWTLTLAGIVSHRRTSKASAERNEKKAKRSDIMPAANNSCQGFLVNLNCTSTYVGGDRLTWMQRSALNKVDLSCLCPEATVALAP